MKHINYFAYPYEERKNIKNNLASQVLAKGNIDEELYKPYKNYQVAKLNDNDLQVKLSSYLFMLIDLNLYLDSYPNDIEALNLFDEYKKRLDEITLEYMQVYGPLTIFDMDNKLYWRYLKGWPWERGEK